MSSSEHSETEIIRQKIVDEYIDRTPKSKAFFARSQESLVAGVTGNLRFFKPYPLYFAGGQGSRVNDIDGYSYIDCFLCNGPLLLGHRPEAVRNSIRQHDTTGSLVVNPMLATEVAERLIDLIPCAERVRFVNSGTEAVMTALRCARAVTGKNKIVKFLGHYHGQSDPVLSGLGNVATPIGDGIPNSSLVDTLVIPYGDIDALKKVYSNANYIAAVLLDPAMHGGGLWGSQKSYLQEVRELTRKHNTLLIFDEVITGFRLALGGAQSFYGVTPDLSTFAKALCAGEKLGAVVGRKEFMDVLDPQRGRGKPRVFQSGTTNDATNALAATLGSLDEFVRIESDDGFTKLANRTRDLATGISDIFKSHGIPHHINHLGSMLQLFLAQKTTPSFAAYSGIDGRPLYLFTLALLAEGVLFALPGSTHVYLSFCHSDEDMESILRGTRNVLERHDFRSLIMGARHYD